MNRYLLSAISVLLATGTALTAQAQQAAPTMTASAPAVLVSGIDQHAVDNAVRV